MVSRLDQLGARRIDPNVTTAKLVNEAYRDLAQSESVRYVIGAMQPIDAEYTKNTFAEGERVFNQLDSKLDESCSHRYQGSVTNDTHIKAKSDIDVLLVIDKFYILEKPQVPAFPYKGNPIQDLLDLRKNACQILKSAFPKATVDSTGSKSLTIEGGSLRRKVDVVPSNWYDSNKYAETKDETFRGVQILDTRDNTRPINMPFLHNELIRFKDQQTGGGLCKAARLMKSLKYDSDDIDLSSYDIVSLAYNIPSADLTVAAGQELRILESCLEFCLAVESNDTHRTSIKVPDDHRPIFVDGHATYPGLIKLLQALKMLSEDVLSENARSFQKLAEARIIY